MDPLLSPFLFSEKIPLLSLGLFSGSVWLLSHLLTFRALNSLFCFFFFFTVLYHIRSLISHNWLSHTTQSGPWLCTAFYGSLIVSEYVNLFCPNWQLCTFARATDRLLCAMRIYRRARSAEGDSWWDGPPAEWNQPPTCKNTMLTLPPESVVARACGSVFPQEQRTAALRAVARVCPWSHCSLAPFKNLVEWHIHKRKSKAAIPRLGLCSS